MKIVIKLLANLLLAAPLLLLVTQSSVAQDAAVVDSAHYSVEFENDDLRVLRIKYGPGEESVMHSHAKGVAISLTDASVTFTRPDGTTEDVVLEAGQVVYTPADTHKPKNTGDAPFEVIQIELKDDKEMME